MRKAVILLSGGLDSTTCLAYAKSKGFICYALTVDYHQRLRYELTAANRIANDMAVEQHEVITLSLSHLTKSALVNEAIAVPDATNGADIPVTYVPARNTLFLSLALGWAETLDAFDIFMGANHVDYSQYPDCRPDYIQAFEQLAQLATKAGVEGKRFTIHTPLMQLNKAEIIQLGLSLKVNYRMTVSCYRLDPDGKACGVCDSCCPSKKRLCSGRG